MFLSLQVGTRVLAQSTAHPFLPDDAAGGQLFGDRRAICTLLLPVNPAGRAAAAMISTGLRAHRYLRRSEGRST
jgi:hypothetical protein